MAVYEVPLTGAPQQFEITLASGRYGIRTLYNDAADGGWTIDISDDLGNPLLCGVPLVTGADLLAQYAYLGFIGKLWVMSEGTHPADVPTFANLGTGSHLYYEV